MKGICRGCNQKKNLIKAHIIPESFFREINTSGQMSILIEGKKDSYIKRCPIGIYDQNILCPECENIFQMADDYAQDLLLKSSNKRRILFDGKGDIYFFENYNYKLLKRFVISLLWRASISKDIFYSHINIGTFETRAKELLWNDSIGTPDEFDFFFYFLGDLKEKSILQPVQCRVNDKNVNRFYLGKNLLFIKVDNRKFDPHPIYARDGEPLYFGSSQESQERVLKEALNIVSKANTSNFHLKTKS